MLIHDKQYLCPVTLELIKNGKAKQMLITRLDCYGINYGDIGRKWEDEYTRLIRDEDIDALRSIIYLDDMTITITTPFDDKAVHKNTNLMQTKVIAYITLKIIDEKNITTDEELKDITQILDDFDFYAKDEVTRTNVKELKAYLTDFLSI